MAIFENVAQVVSQAGRELGLISADVADPYASSDPNVLQLCSLLTSAGREIIREKNWSQSLVATTFATVGGQEEYTLPADFMRMMPQSQWNRTTRLPLGGPLSPQEWEYLSARVVVVNLRILFRPQNLKIHIFGGSSIPNAHTIAYEYMSSYWVKTAAGDVPTATAPTLKDDILYFDTFLLSRALKRAFLRAKGFDATNAEADYIAALDSVMTDDGPAPTLSLNGAGGASGLLNNDNAPDTGYGA